MRSEFIAELAVMTKIVYGKLINAALYRYFNATACAPVQPLRGSRDDGASTAVRFETHRVCHWLAPGRAGGRGCVGKTGSDGGQQLSINCKLMNTRRNLRLQAKLLAVPTYAYIMDFMQVTIGAIHVMMYRYQLY